MVVRELERMLKGWDMIKFILSYGVCFFGSGGSMGYDILATEAVLSVSNQVPEIKIIMFLPCLEHDRFWNEEWKRRLEAVKRKAAKIVYTSECYNEDCMYKRNRHLVKHAGYCVTYFKKDSGGTVYTVSCAKKNGLKVLRYPETI